MAISWKFNVSEIGISGNYNISAEVTDDTLPAEKQTQTVSVQGRLDTEAQKEGAIAALKTLYQEKVALVVAEIAIETDMKGLAEK